MATSKKMSNSWARHRAGKAGPRKESLGDRGEEEWDEELEEEGPGGRQRLD